MQKILETRIKAAEQLKDPTHVRVAVLSLFRIGLQHACVSLGEWIAAALHDDPSKFASYTAIDLKEFSTPSDGGLVALLSQLLVAAENIGWRHVGKVYWEQFEYPNPLKELTGVSRGNIETVLSSFVRMRNDSGEGHGISGAYTPETDVAVLRALIERTSGFLPTAGKDGQTLLLPALGDLPAASVTTLKLFEGDPICYRRLRRTSAGRLQVDAQVQRTLLSRNDVSYEIKNVLMELPRPATPEYRIDEPVWTDQWRPFVFVPERLASEDVFTGRVGEMSALAEWADDPDSRKCMVHGDGGVGKTTLVVEFLHRFLEGRTTVAWRPELVTFYTTKKTRWGLNGLEHISAQDIGVADVALDIARMLTTPNLDKSWFDKSPKDVIQKLASLLAEMKISRDAHLIVLDNTETMARSDADIQSLALQINELSRRVGRVILTSRRREQIEALPIQTENWTEEEGAEFLKKRGHALSCTSIAQAGVPTLRKYSRTLVNKPIALEVFVQAASAPGIGLDNALQRVQRMQRQDLGQFLYDDAWARLSPGLRRLLLLMSRVGDAHDQYLLQLCCQRADVTVAAASDAIEESRGIATINRFEGALQITFNPEFFQYCAERTELVEGKRTPTDDDVLWVRRRYAEFVASASSQVYDRNIRAFRVPSARAAWKAFTEERAEVLDYYEIAAMEDPDNGWFFERYAHTLMKLRKFDLALEKAKKAELLLPEDQEVQFTKGMIEARIGLVGDALASLENAEKRGKAKHLCDLQRAYAYVHASPKQFPDAEACLSQALRNAPKDKFLSRFVSEATALQRRYFPS